MNSNATISAAEAGVKPRPPVTVVDSIMGSGKSQWAIQHMRARTDENFLYITPFLDEVARFIKALGEPSDPNKCGFADRPREFHQPMHKGEGKLASLNDLLKDTKDICSTHELFKHFDEETKKTLVEKKYTLIIDEVTQPIEPFKFKPGDFQILKEAGCVTVDENHFVHWHEKPNIPNDISFSELRNLATNKLLLNFDKTFLVWQYPPKIFRLFDRIVLLTFMFEASVMSHYFQLHGMAYEKKSVHMDKANGRYELTDYIKPDTNEIAKLVNIYEGPMNSNFPKKNSKQKDNWLSSTWLGKTGNKGAVAQLKKNIDNYLRNTLKAHSDSILWTSLEKVKCSLHGNRYLNQFETWNCRATNKHSEKFNIAYVLNVYPQLATEKYFQQYNIKFNAEAYALSEMVQFLWRSRIRNGGSVNVYVPSNRMRWLLQRWLEK